MRLENVVPFGRSMDEYRCMFMLTAADLDKKIIGIADGPASFNAEMSDLGKPVVSVDPLYIFSGEEIETRFHAVVDDIISQVQATPDDWVWAYHRSPAHLRENRLQVLDRFLADYRKGKADGRYVVGELPALRFADNTFQLALCSHLLFLYSDHFGYEFHRDAVLEMLRVAPEVRVFPLLTLSLEISRHMSPLVAELSARGFTVKLERVDYELQRGGHEMMRIQRAGL
ncbi:MAG: SAM-dependent methyltransferase [Pseudomonadota bacterium]